MSLFKIYYSVILLWFFSRQVFSQIAVDTSFEGANARVISINNPANTIKIKSNLRPGDVHNVVFYCRIYGFNPSQPLKVQVQYTDQSFVPVLAAYSYDKVTWYRFRGVFSGDSKEYTHTYNLNSVYFSSGYPYVYSDLLSLANFAASSQFAQVSDIAVSFGGRNVKLIRITEPCVPDTGKYLVWVLGRNHAMESHSNYVVDGFVRFLLSSDPHADKLRRRAIIYVVPVMDVDNAAIGGTGKDQLPVDFNRDWDSPSYWPAVIAVKQRIAESVLHNPLKVFLDSHDPFPGDSTPIFFYSIYSSGIKSANLDFYRKLLLENGGYNYDRQTLYLTDGQTSQRWVDSMYANIDFSVGLETGWVNRTDGAEWTIPLYTYNGVTLAKGMNDYLGNVLKQGDIILDNTDTLNGVQITGSWIASAYYAGYWGINYVHNNNSGQGDKSVQYTPVFPQEGDYEVFLRWTSDSARADNVPVRITYSGGTKDTIISQRTRGSEWVSAGIFHFAPGSPGSVLLQTGGTDGYVIADAVRFSPMNNCNPIGIINSQTPSEFSLSVCPNPFNPSTKVRFELPRPGNVSIRIYDLAGRLVATLLNGFVTGGAHEVVFNASNLSSGVYFLSFRTDAVTENRKLVFIK